jgi:hypothetical protein
LDRRWGGDCGETCDRASAASGHCTERTGA